jgi:hypothetical protein
MKGMNRRGFLKLAGLGTAATATAAIPTLDTLFRNQAGTITFRAVGGVPEGPLPSYASYVLEGYVDLTRKAGSLTRTVVAGHPGQMSQLALPGLSRTVRITDVRRSGDVVHILGVIADRSHLSAGESPDVEIRIDRLGGVVWTRSGRNEAKLKLQR